MSDGEAMTAPAPHARNGAPSATRWRIGDDEVPLAEVMGQAPGVATGDDERRRAADGGQRVGRLVQAHHRMPDERLDLELQRRPALGRGGVGDQHDLVAVAEERGDAGPSRVGQRGGGSDGADEKCTHSHPQNVRHPRRFQGPAVSARPASTVASGHGPPQCGGRAQGSTDCPSAAREPAERSEAGDRVTGRRSAAAV